MKKVLSMITICLTVLAVVWLFPKTVRAEQDGDWTYTVNTDGTAVITRYEGSDAVVTVPASVGGHTVKKLSRFGAIKTVQEITVSSGIIGLGDYVFNGCSVLKKVSIPASVETIGKQAFSSCPKLEEVIIDGANSHYKFANKALLSKDGKKFIECFESNRVPYAVPEGVTIICKEAFYSAGEITEITLPTSLETIEAKAFSKLIWVKSLYIPKNVTNLEEGFKDGLDALAELTVDPANQTYKTINSVLFTKDGTTLILGVKTSGDYEVPSGVTLIKNRAFDGCSKMTSVKFPSTLKEIGDWAFQYCSGLQEVILPEGIEKTGRNAFGNCRNLKKVYVPSSLTDMDQYLFGECSSLEEVVIAEGTKTIGFGMFYRCTALKVIALPESVEKIKDLSFRQCSLLETVVLPSKACIDWTINSLWTPFEGCSELKDVYFTGTQAQYQQMLDAAGADNGALRDATLHLISPYQLTILRQPENAYGKSGDPFTLKVFAYGKGLSYQWQYNNGTQWVSASDGGNKTNELSGILPDDTKSYRCKITDSNGKTAYSSEVIVSGRTLDDVLNAKGQSMHFECPTGDGLRPWIPQNMYGRDCAMSGNKGESKTKSIMKTTITVTELSELSFYFRVWGGGYMVHNCGYFTVNGEEQFRYEALDNDWTRYSKVLSEGTYELVWTYEKDSFANNDGPGDYFAVSEVKVVKALQFTKQPKDFSGYFGEEYCFSVAVNKKRTSYQWQISKDQGYTWDKLQQDSAKTATVRGTINDGVIGSLIRCKAYDKDGCITYSDAVTVKEATLKLIKEPTDFIGYQGDVATFTVEAVGSNLTYQWQQKKDGNWVKSARDGAKTKTLSVPVTTNLFGLEFRCVVKDRHGKTKYTKSVFLKQGELPDPPAITKQPTDWTGTYGKKASFTVEATGDNLTYQWQYRKDDVWNNYDLATADTANFKVTMNERNVRWALRCVITDRHGRKVVSSKVYMKLAPVFAITKQPVDWTGVYGKKASFSVTATGEGLTYQWQYKKGTTWNDYAIETADTANFKVTMNEKNVKWAYRCVITDASGNTLITNEVNMSLAE